ncbi:MAG: inositol monophosphatase [Mariprofundaceae bacterium]|nr:inositol monophosphatase [Mariprofundaceae bacterium]
MVFDTKQTLIAALNVHDIATLLVQAGQQILLPLFYRQDFTQQQKTDCSIVTEADTRCQFVLQQQLQQYALTAWPDGTIGFLGEEMSEDEQYACLTCHETFWCLDPLDGTGNFAANTPLFTVSLALIHRGSPIMAWIHDPCRNETFMATAGGGFCINGCRWRSRRAVQKLTQATGFIDFKRLSASSITPWIQPMVYRSQRNLGSCALEWAWLAGGRGAFIVHGKQKLWDYAAGVLLCEEAGGSVSDFCGNHPFSTSRLHSSIAAAANQSLHQQMLLLVRN